MALLPILISKITKLVAVHGYQVEIKGDEVILSPVSTEKPKKKSKKSK